MSSDRLPRLKVSSALLRTYRRASLVDPSLVDRAAAEHPPERLNRHPGDDENKNEEPIACHRREASQAEDVAFACGKKRPIRKPAAVAPRNEVTNHTLRRCVNVSDGGSILSSATGFSLSLSIVSEGSGTAFVYPRDLRCHHNGEDGGSQRERPTVWRSIVADKDEAHTRPKRKQVTSPDVQPQVTLTFEPLPDEFDAGTSG
jgi:hypothetical protein